MPVLQPIVDLVELLYQKGIREVLISPGSRSAPLTLAFVRHGKFTTRVVPDERSAGFVALGLAQQHRTEGRVRPVAIVCTSGSAVYNLSPAVVEAYFQEIPLLILTADRPREWVYQQDGQTIVQAGLFGSHVKRGYDLPADYSHADARWFIERTTNEAINLSQSVPYGPVHINVPLREPFYPKPDDRLLAGAVRVIEQLPTSPQLPPDVWHRLLDEWQQAERKLIVVGQLPPNPALQTVLQQIGEDLGVPIVAEIISNQHRGGEVIITQSDTLLDSTDPIALELLRPELLITIGNGILSRNLKTFLRKYPARRHWHIQPTTDRIADSFQSLTTLIPAEPAAFFERLFADIDYQRFREGDEEDEGERDFLSHWQSANYRAARRVQQHLVTSPFTDWQAMQTLLEALPNESMLQLANSMPVRYANLCGLDASRGIGVSANRGTSGIDGCLSTAVGAALATQAIVTVCIGDVAFFYDRNGLWQHPLPTNLRIVLFNNNGGHIFRIIDGPSQQPELETYFETPHTLTAARTAADFGLDYTTCHELPGLLQVLDSFYELGIRPKLLEIKTNKQVNAEAFRQYRNMGIDC